MGHNTVDEMIEVLQAFKAGKVIQFKNGGTWDDLLEPGWNFHDTKYRVKPKEPREIWVNEYRDGSVVAYASKSQAEKRFFASRWRTAVLYREVTGD